MSDAAFSRRRTDLLTRVKRRRKEVETYLDDFFYSRCREVFRRVRVVDSGDKLERLSGPSSDHTAAPGGWAAVKRRLDNYEYAKASDFIEDMRSIVNHCYDSHNQGLIDVARNVELAMEDQFVQWLAVAPANFQTISELARRAPKSTKLAMVEIIAFYNVKCQTVGSDAQRFSVSASEVPNATKFRLLKLLQSGARHPTARERPPASTAARKTPIPPVALQTRPEPPRPAPSKALLSGPDSALQFHDEDTRHSRVPPPLPSSSTSNTAVQLERVPQNDPKEAVSAAVISPVIMQDDDENSSSEDGDAGG